MKTERYAVLSDVHFPFEQRQLYAVTLKILRDVSPQAIYLNGDIGEFQGVSSHPIHPKESKIPFMDEIEYMNKKFDELGRLFPDVPVVYLCGNHEYRLFRFIRDLAPQLWGVAPDCPQLLKFHERPRWKFVDYSPAQIVRCGKSNLYLRHEPFSGGSTAAKLLAERSDVDLLTGHLHTQQMASAKRFGVRSRIIKGYVGGFLGDKTRHIFDYRGAKDNWVEGFSLIECDTATGDYTYEFIDLTKIPVLYRGKSFNAK